MSWLSRYDPARTLARPAPLVALWLSGQTVHSHSHLAPGQRLLLDDLAAVGWSTVPGGLPFTDPVCRPPCRAAGLPLASVRSTAQYLAARTGGTFARDVARHLQPLVDATGRTLLVVLGSAGAEVLTAAWAHLRVPAALDLRVIALGPVGRLPSGARVLVVRGERDLVSRLGHLGPSDVVVPGRHLGYAERDEVRAVVRETGRRWAAESTTGTADELPGAR